jgi:hypothetical protein
MLLNPANPEMADREIAFHGSSSQGTTSLLPNHSTDLTLPFPVLEPQSAIDSTTCGTHHTHVYWRSRPRGVPSPVVQGRAIEISDSYMTTEVQENIVEFEISDDEWIRWIRECIQVSHRWMIPWPCKKLIPRASSAAHIFTEASSGPGNLLGLCPI